MYDEEDDSKSKESSEAEIHVFIVFRNFPPEAFDNIHDGKLKWLKVKQAHIGTS